MGLQADNRTQIEATEYNQDYTRTGVSVGDRHAASGSDILLGF